MFDETVTIAKFMNKFKIYDLKSRIKNSKTQKNSPRLATIKRNFNSLETS